MLKKSIGLTFFLIAVIFVQADAKYNVLDYDVSSDGQQLVTAELQKVIDLCHEEGGGVVYFPAGNYLTGSLFLKSGVFLEIGPNATILGSTDIEDYSAESLISADHARDIGIVGQGTIDGQGRAFWEGKERPYVRPKKILNFDNCENIKISDIALTNAPHFNIALGECNLVWIDGISIRTDLEAPNTDGIDPSSSSNVFISNCYISTGDDAICLKSHGNIATENIVVQNCVLISDDSAIKLGTTSEAPIRNCSFNNIIIRNTHFGIGLFAKDGGVYQNIRFSNITIETRVNETVVVDKPSRNYAIFMDLEKRTPESPLSQIKDIYFNDITIDSQDASCLFLGQPDQKIENLFLSNVHYKQSAHTNTEGKKKPRGTRRLRDRAANDYSHIPSNFTFAYVKNLHIEDLTIDDYSEQEEYDRHMVWGISLESVIVRNFRSRLAKLDGDKAQMVFIDSVDLRIIQSEPADTQSAFLKLEGEQTSNVSLLFNHLSSAVNRLEIGSEVDPTELFEIPERSQ